MARPGHILLPLMVALAAPAPARPAGEDGGDGARARIADIGPEVIFWEHLYDGPFASPGGVWCDKRSGEIYVADTGNDRIGVFDANGQSVFAFQDREHLREPRRVVRLHDGRILVLDRERSRLKIFSYRGEFLGTFRPPSDAPEASIGAISLDEDGNLYVGENAGGEVQVFDPALELRFRFGSLGDGDAQFRSISGIAPGPKRIAVVDQVVRPVQVFDRAGNFLRGWGEHQMGPANFSLPQGVAWDARGRVVVVDALRQEIKVFLEDGTFVGRWGGMGAGPGQVRFPSDVSSDAKGRLCVSERVGSRVQLLVEIEEERDGAKRNGG